MTRVPDDRTTGPRERRRPLESQFDAQLSSSYRNLVIKTDDPSSPYCGAVGNDAPVIGPRRRGSAGASFVQVPR